MTFCNFYGYLNPIRNIHVHSYSCPHHELGTLPQVYSEAEHFFCRGRYLPWSSLKATPGFLSSTHRSAFRPVTAMVVILLALLLAAPLSAGAEDFRCKKLGFGALGYKYKYIYICVSLRFFSYIRFPASPIRSIEQRDNSLNQGRHLNPAPQAVTSDSRAYKPWLLLEPT